MSAFKRNALTFGITFCISVLIFGVIAYIIMSMFFGSPKESSEADGSALDDMIIGFEDTVDNSNSGTSFTALLVGTDYQPQVTPDAPSRADSIILVRFSSETESVIYMNIPAVTLTTVDGKEMTLSKAYTEKGIDYLSEKIQGLTGLQINYYAIASVAIFDDIINDLGGIEDYPVPVNMDYEDESQNLVIDIDKGTQDLDGLDTIKMLRYCSDSYSDRMLRNVQFIRTLVEKYTQMSYHDQAKTLYNTVFENLVSNFEEDDLLAHLDTIYSYSFYQGKVLTFPGDFKTVDGNVYFNADVDKSIEMLAEYKNY